MTRRELVEEFGYVFGTKDNVRTFFSPGRVNLIGEHTDYNGGHVFPCALTIGTYAAVEKRTDSKVCFYSLNFKESGIIETSLDDVKFKKEDGWANYPKGVIKIFENHGMKLDSGFNILIYGDLPNSSGLSSSASLEVLTAFIIKEMFDFDLDMIEIAKLCKEAENEFCGVNCGIMDQFAIAMGKEKCAIYLDTATLNYLYVPIELKDYRLVIIASNKKRGLSDSKYNERRTECESALKQINERLFDRQFESLGEFDKDTFDKYVELINDNILKRRAKHAVYENLRTVMAVELLNNGNLLEFGSLMMDSHKSLRDDYEVTGRELDVLFDLSSKEEGVIGTRMTGAGFGGCCIALVDEKNVEDFIERVGTKYTEKTNIKADFYVMNIGGGPKELF